MNPYEVLGVPPDADDDAIKQAYRRRASQCHPDKGGTDEQMQEVAKAYMILSDPERRAAFDNGGHRDDGPSPHDKARDMVMQGFRQELNNGHHDPVGAVRDNLKKVLARIQSELASAPMTRRRIEKAINATSVKQGENLLHLVANQALVDLDTHVEKVKRDKQLMTIALGIVDNYEVEQEPEAVPSWSRFLGG